VNALWLRSLDVTARLTNEADMRDRCSTLHAQAASSFSARFPRPDGVGLYDLVDGPAGDDASIRPKLPAVMVRTVADSPEVRQKD